MVLFLVFVDQWRYEHRPELFLGYVPPVRRKSLSSRGKKLLASVADKRHNAYALNPGIKHTSPPPAYIPVCVADIKMHTASVRVDS